MRIKYTIVSLIALALSFNASAQIRVYDPSTGEQKSLDYLQQVGAVKDVESLKRENEKIIAKDDRSSRMQSQKDMIKMMKQAPDRHKPIEEQKMSGAGLIVVFIDPNTVNADQGRLMNSISSIRRVRKEFFFKTPKTGAGALVMSVRLDNTFPKKLTLDNGNGNARRLGVSNYPQIVYVMPDGTRARYALTKQGVMALRMRIGEVEALLQNQQMTVNKR